MPDERSAALVLDASVVILKWVVDAETEPGHAAARRLLERWLQGELDLLVPALWLYVVGNILCLKRPADASEALAALWDLGLSEAHLNQELIQRTLALSQSHGVTFYDASYLALAEERKTVLVELLE